GHSGQPVASTTGRGSLPRSAITGLVVMPVFLPREVAQAGNSAAVADFTAAAIFTAAEGFTVVADSMVAGASTAAVVVFMAAAVASIAAEQSDT
ncbi:MAG: hypothetical protein KGI75_27250, partial [Rhizobiaceae bacterium]|nr:hypothetical protein [Rhizobiaceae bacterium]